MSYKARLLALGVAMIVACSAMTAGLEIGLRDGPELFSFALLIAGAVVFGISDALAKKHLPGWP